ncbi:hypothetical protein ACFE04_009385 [Oxalis oulophora]
MAGVAPEGFFRGFNIYDGCISGNDMGMQQRPYHRNCGCALHDKKSGKGKGSHCTHVKSSVKNVNVSYPLRRVWSEGSSLLAMASNCHTSPPSSHFSSPLVDGGSAGGGAGGGGIPRSKSQHHLSN